MRMILTASVVAISALTLSACDKPPIVGFCELYQAKDFRDPGLRKQNRRNKNADKVNEETRQRLCV